MHTVLRRRLGFRDGDDVDAQGDRVRPDDAADGSDVGGPEPADRQAINSLDVHLSRSQRHVGEPTRPLQVGSNSHPAIPAISAMTDMPITESLDQRGIVPVTSNTVALKELSGTGTRGGKH